MTNSAAIYQAALEKLHQYLQGYGPLTKHEFREMEPYIEIREFDKRVKVIHEGEVERYLNIVAQGLARKYLPVRNKEITIQLASEGHMIHSELSFHYRVPSRSVVETIEPTVFFSISYDSLEQLYEQIPGIERLGRLLITDLFIKSDTKYFNQLRKSTRERFLEYVRTHPDMVQRVPQKYLASFLNIKPETFSRLKHLTRGGKTLKG
ncbi:MAG TPA: Crp/Fnr family transcriptional regulator [Puia sp.]|jgi:CRP-like cAMP-binding protein|nr:Crp/Fnr family transcriptional regulator [Puia sp.]